MFIHAFIMIVFVAMGAAKLGVPVEGTHGLRRLLLSAFQIGVVKELHKQD